MNDTPKRRRLDRILADGYLEGLEGWSAEEVRAARDDCRAEEAQLSYLRRLLQARLDLVRAEQRRRREGAGSTQALSERLAGLLADAPAGARRDARALTVDPPATQMRRAEDRLASDATLARVPDLDAHALTALADELANRETEISEKRRVLLDRLDHLQDELVARYRDGGSSAVDAVVAEAVRAHLSGGDTTR